MKLTLDGFRIETTLEELVEVINGRQKAAWTDPTMSDGKSENYLIKCMNDGVNLMAKYMKDWFANEFDKQAREQYGSGGAF